MLVWAMQSHSFSFSPGLQAKMLVWWASKRQYCHSSLAQKYNAFAQNIPWYIRFCTYSACTVDCLGNIIKLFMSDRAQHVFIYMLMSWWLRAITKLFFLLQRCCFFVFDVCLSFFCSISNERAIQSQKHFSSVNHMYNNGKYK